MLLAVRRFVAIRDAVNGVFLARAGGISCAADDCHPLMIRLERRIYESSILGETAEGDRRVERSDVLYKEVPDDE
jgi:hypothetical protein